MRKARVLQFEKEQERGCFLSGAIEFQKAKGRRENKLTEERKRPSFLGLSEILQRERLEVHVKTDTTGKKGGRKGPRLRIYFSKRKDCISC